MNNYQALKEAILDVSLSTSKEDAYRFNGICPYDIVKILENDSEFDEWIYSTIQDDGYVYDMYINGGKYEIVVRFNFWYGTLVIFKNE